MQLKKLLTVVGLSACLLGYAQEKASNKKTHIIDITESYDSLILPDEIYIQIILSEKDTKERTPIIEMETKMVDALQKLGINTDKDLYTSDMLSNFKNRFLGAKEVVKTKEYNLMVRTATMVGAVFEAFQSLGIANTTITRVALSNFREVKNISELKAIANAQTRAKAMAAVLGQRIGKAIFMANNESAYYNDYDSENVEITMARFAPPKIMNDTKGISSIEFKKMKIEAKIRIQFELE